MSSKNEPRRGKPVVGHKVKGQAPIGWRPSPGPASALASSVEAAPVVQLDESVAHGASAEALRNDPANDLGIPSNEARPNGDEVDVRMAEHSAATDRCCLKSRSFDWRYAVGWF